MSDKELCNICKIEMDNPNDLTTENCGGDCLYCMHVVGDPDCTIKLVEIFEQENAKLKEAVSKDHYDLIDENAELRKKLLIAVRGFSECKKRDYGCCKSSDIANKALKEIEEM